MPLRRKIKNVVANYTAAELLVRDATSNDHCAPDDQLLMKIADATKISHYYDETTRMIFKRLNDKTKNWRHIYKALLVIETCIRCGSITFVKECQSQIAQISTLTDFQYLDNEGVDIGRKIRDKAVYLSRILKDPILVDEERRTARNERAKIRRLGRRTSSCTITDYSSRLSLSSGTSKKNLWDEEYLQKQNPRQAELETQAKKLTLLEKASCLDRRDFSSLSMLAATTDIEEEEHLRLAIRVSLGTMHEKSRSIDFDAEDPLTPTDLEPDLVDFTDDAPLTDQEKCHFESWLSNRSMAKGNTTQSFDVSSTSGMLQDSTHGGIVSLDPYGQQPNTFSKFVHLPLASAQLAEDKELLAMDPFGRHFMPPNGATSALSAEAVVNAKQPTETTHLLMDTWPSTEKQADPTDFLGAHQNLVDLNLFTTPKPLPPSSLFNHTKSFVSDSQPNPPWYDLGANLTPSIQWNTSAPTAVGATIFGGRQQQSTTSGVPALHQGTSVGPRCANGVQLLLSQQRFSPSQFPSVLESSVQMTTGLQGDFGLQPLPPPKIALSQPSFTNPFL